MLLIINAIIINAIIIIIIIIIKLIIKVDNYDWNNFHYNL